MKYNSDFRYDLKYGQKEEQFIHELLSTDGEIKLEVKSDRRAQITGNVYIEYESRGKPSGISTSEADYYALKFLSGTVLLVPLDKLKRFCKQLPDKKKNKVGGDNNSSRGCLIKVHELMEYLIMHL